MNLRRMAIPVALFLVAGVVLAVTFLTDDDPGLIDTSGVATTAPNDAEGMGPTLATTTTAAPPDDRPSVARMAPLRVQNQAMAVGKRTAPLVMVTFESYGCGWCGHFHTRTMPELMKRWVDTGRLRIESRMMPYEERAQPGALVGTAAGMQDKYWELSEVMYPYITGGGEPLFDREPTAEEMEAYHRRQSETAMLAEVQSVADDLGIDWDRFLADYRSPEAAERMNADTRLGNSIGFTSTPAMVVNGVPLGGYSSYERMDEVLTQVLEQSSGGS